MIIDLPQFPNALQQGRRVLGIDQGTKTLGLAISDPDLRVATSLKTLRRTKFKQDAAALLTIVAEKNVGGVVLGLPLNMDGTEGPRCQSVRTFARNLDHALRDGGHDLPHTFWDERLSTSVVERFLITEADATRATRQRSVDHQAATYILQGALDYLGRCA